MLPYKPKVVQTPEQRKAYQNEYNHRPDVKEKRADFYRQPEKLADARVQSKEYYANNKEYVLQRQHEYRSDSQVREHYLEVNQQYRNSLKDRVRSLKLELSGGTCMTDGCTASSDVCHLHHCIAAHKIKNFAEMASFAEIDTELDANTTEDGEIQLLVLCPGHHTQLHQKLAAANTPGVVRYVAADTQAKIDLVNTWKRQQHHCALCEQEPFCVKGQESFFHCDHIFVKNDPRCSPDMAKLFTIGTACRDANVTIEMIAAELKKCRLLHGFCHVQHTVQQHKDGIFTAARANRT